MQVLPILNIDEGIRKSSLYRIYLREYASASYVMKVYASRPCIKYMLVYMQVVPVCTHTYIPAPVMY